MTRLLYRHLAAQTICVNSLNEGVRIFWHHLWGNAVVLKTAKYVVLLDMDSNMFCFNEFHSSPKVMSESPGTPLINSASSSEYERFYVCCEMSV